MNLQKACVITLFLIAGSGELSAQGSPAGIRDAMVGSAFTGAAGPRILERLSDETGGRLMGTPGNERGLAILMEELAGIGYAPRREEFTAPGWERGADQVTVTSPLLKTLRAAALGYTDAAEPLTGPFEETLLYAGSGMAEEYPARPAKGKIVLVSSEPPRGKSPLLRYEVIDIAAARGARAVLFINDKEGGLLLCGVGNFQGVRNAIPAFSITMEEGNWLKRQIARGTEVTVRMEVRSRVRSVRSANVVATLPGKDPRKLVVGAHIDSWDLSQGSLDNGIGSAILFDVARLLRAHPPAGGYTLEFVWFNGEELGLWGSQRYLEVHGAGEIAAVVNLDMTGSPQGFNVMGHDEAIPLLRTIVAALPGFQLDTEIQSVPWTNSDHQPFLVAGIPSISPYGSLDGSKARFYHDFADTFDKVNGKGLCEAAAVVAVLVRELAGSGLPFRRATKEETIQLLRKHGVEERLKRQKEWPY